MRLKLFFLFVSVFFLLEPAFASPIFTSVEKPQLVFSDFNGAYGSRSFYGTVCTWSPCRRPDMYRKHELRVNVLGDRVTILFMESVGNEMREFRRLAVPADLFMYYEQNFGGYSEGFETFFLDDPVSKEVHEQDGITTVREIVPTLEVRFVRFKNKSTDSHYLFGYEHIEGVIVRTTLTSSMGEVIARHEEMAPEISNQYVRDREALPPNF